MDQIETKFLKSQGLLPVVWFKYIGNREEKLIEFLVQIKGNKQIKMKSFMVMKQSYLHLLIKQMKTMPPSYQKSAT